MTVCVLQHTLKKETTWSELATLTTTDMHAQMVARFHDLYYCVESHT